MLEKPVPFYLKNVLDLTLAAEEPEAAGRHEAAIVLTNGDLVRGQLASATDEVVELDTWFAGRMKFNRLMIEDIRISERPDLLYRGPKGLDGWILSGEKSAWTYQAGGLVSQASGGIARNVNLPDECSVAFDTTWRGAFGLKLVLFSDDLESGQPKTGYEVLFQQKSIQLRSCKTQRFIGHSPNALSLQENEKARIEVRASLKSGKVCVFVDGHIIEVWTDPEVARNDVGRGIHFIVSNPSPVKVSRIEVGTWDGEVKQVPDPEAPGGLPPVGLGDEEMDDEVEPALARPAENPKAGRMELRNGVSIVGEVVAIVDGMIHVKTPFRDVKLPVESLRSLALKSVSLERCKRENGDVRAWLPDGSSLVFRLDGVGDGLLTGYSQNFGTTRFKVSAFNRIEFNIYEPGLEEIRMSNGW